MLSTISAHDLQVLADWIGRAAATTLIGAAVVPLRRTRLGRIRGFQRSTVGLDVAIDRREFGSKPATTRTMLERTRQRLGLRLKRLAADTTCGIVRFLAFVIDAGIIPHIPAWDMSKRYDDTFSQSEFSFDRKRNVYI